jgi:DNA-binding MarR family transcriptional regulator
MNLNTLETGTEPLAHRVAAGLSKIGVAIKSRAWKEAGKRRITPLQGQALAFLRMRAAQTVTVSAIADELAVTLPTVSEVVRALAEKGLVKKIRSESDGRVVTVRLSVKGKRLAEGAAGWPDFLAAVADQLPVTEQEALLRTLIKMIRTMQERGEIPIARMCVTCRFFHPNAHPDLERPHHCALVDASFGDRSLRIECGEHQAATKENSDRNWAVFLDGASRKLSG